DQCGYLNQDRLSSCGLGLRNRCRGEKKVSPAARARSRRRRPRVGDRVWFESRRAHHRNQEEQHQWRTGLLPRRPPRQAQHEWWDRLNLQ
ncbi:unnamed protein product, partial [Ascophyllum nodosum]